MPLGGAAQGSVSVAGLAGSPMASHIAMAGAQIPGLTGLYKFLLVSFPCYNLFVVFWVVLILYHACYKCSLQPSLHS